MLMKNVKHGKLYRILLHIDMRNKTTVTVREAIQGFDDFFPSVVDKIPTRSFGTPEVVEDVKRTVQYGANEDCKLRGSIALLSYELLEKPQNITAESLDQIRTLAWGAELVNTYGKILEDMERYPGHTGLHQHNPGLLKSCVYEMLRDEFIDNPCYVDLVHLFNKGFLHCAIGSYLDVSNSFRRSGDFSMERYNSLVQYQSSYPTFELPIALSKEMSKNVDYKAYQEVKSVCSDLGKLYHMRNDYLDCYGEETDHSQQIQDGKCTWLAVTALQRLSATQKIVFTSCYGSKQPAHIERLKLLYDQLQMKTLVKDEEEKICAEIRSKAEKLRDNSKKMVLEIVGLIMNKSLKK